MPVSIIKTSFPSWILLRVTPQKYHGGTVYPLQRQIPLLYLQWYIFQVLPGRNSLFLPSKKSRIHCTNSLSFFCSNNIFHSCCMCILHFFFIEAIANDCWQLSKFFKYRGRCYWDCSGATRCSSSMKNYLLLLVKFK